MKNNQVSIPVRKSLEPEVAGLVAGFLGSIPFISIMMLVPVTLFMRLMKLAMPFMPQINIFGWMLHALVNSFWGFLFILIIEKWNIKRIFLTSLVWSLFLVGLVLVAVPLVGLQVSQTLVVVEVAAYINYAIVLWAVYLVLAKKR